MAIEGKLYRSIDPIGTYFLISITVNAYNYKSRQLILNPMEKWYHKRGQKGSVSSAIIL